VEDIVSQHGRQKTQLLEFFSIAVTKPKQPHVNASDYVDGIGRLSRLTKIEFVKFDLQRRHCADTLFGTPGEFLPESLSHSRLVYMAL
jgi:hypothetical protein